MERSARLLPLAGRRPPYRDPSRALAVRQRRRSRGAVTRTGNICCRARTA